MVVYDNLDIVKLPIRLYKKTFKDDCDSNYAFEDEVFTQTIHQSLINELVTLYQTQYYLLVIQKDCRIALHSLSDKFCQKYFMSDLFNESLNRFPEKNQKTVVETLFSELQAEKNGIEFSIPNNFENTRNLSVDKSKKLQTCVFNKLLRSLTDLIIVGERSELEKNNSKVITNSLDSSKIFKNLSEKFKDAYKDSNLYSDLIKELNMKLNELCSNKDEFWINFWEETSLEVDPDFFGRSMHREWLHNYHPDRLANTEWTALDEARFLEFLAENTDKNFKLIAKKMKRTVYDVYTQYLKISQNSNKKSWSLEEDNFLLSFVSNHNFDEKTYTLKQKFYIELLDALENRSTVECRNRIKFLTNKKELKNVNWTLSEDLILQYLVAIHGKGNWKAIKNTGWLNKTEPQIRERYVNILDSDNNPDSSWTREDDNKLIFLVETALESKKKIFWSTIASELNRRNDAECTKRWNKINPKGAAIYSATNSFDKLKSKKSQFNYLVSIIQNIEVISSEVVKVIRQEFFDSLSIKNSIDLKILVQETPEKFFTSLKKNVLNAIDSFETFVYFIEILVEDINFSPKSSRTFVSFIFKNIAYSLKIIPEIAGFSPHDPLKYSKVLKIYQKIISLQGLSYDPASAKVLHSNDSILQQIDDLIDKDAEIKKILIQLIKFPCFLV